MDARLKKALEFSNYRQTLNNQMQALKIKAQTDLSYSKNGGSFAIDRSLITFIKAVIDEGQEEVVILDKNDTPILIDDLDEFYEEILSRYFEVTNEYKEQYEKIRRARSVKAVIEYDDEEQ